ncbi:PGF-CTERM sorting domain-containing protein [Haloarchaeobius sp. DT45]|uniref:PGF-CTERM sorting domain-containing protein n=1 Tax=Haloarchaeobius sp. DT45 TaxID=3446116 RepID=UPI003F6CA307
MTSRFLRASTLLALALTVSLVVVASATGAPATSTGPADVSDGPHEVGQTLETDTFTAGTTVELRQQDGDAWAFVTQLAVADDGTLTIETESLDPGTYRLLDDQGTEQTFELLAGDGGTGDDGTGDEGTGGDDGAQNDTSDDTDGTPVPVSEGPHESGQTLETDTFTADTTLELQQQDGDTWLFVSELVVDSDGTLTVETDALDPGTYRLVDDQGTEQSFELVAGDGDQSSQTETDNTDGDTVPVTDGPHEVGQTLETDTFTAGTTVELRQQDGDTWAFVAQLAVTDAGVLTLETTDLDPGTYRLAAGDGTHLQFDLGDGDTADPTRTEAGLVWQGQPVESDAFAAGSTVELQQRDGDTWAFVAEFTPGDDGLTVPTTDLDRGQYRLVGEQNSTVTFTVTEQALAVNADQSSVENVGDDGATTATLDVSSNRDSYTLHVTSASLSPTDLVAILGAGEPADSPNDDDADPDYARITVDGTDTTVTADAAGLPPGTYTLSFESADTTATASVDLTVERGSESSDDEAGGAGDGAGTDSQPTTVQGAADEGTEGSPAQKTPGTTTTSPTDSTTTAGGTEPTAATDDTSGAAVSTDGSPGFGALLALLALAGTVLLGRRVA